VIGKAYSKSIFGFEERGWGRKTGGKTGDKVSGPSQPGRFAAFFLGRFGGSWKALQGSWSPPKVDRPHFLHCSGAKC
jgi:hypothetical protein